MADIKKKKASRIIVPTVIIIIALIVLVSVFSKSAYSLYSEETAELRDIVKYHTFTGTVETDDSVSVAAEVSQKVISLNVSEGDEVAAGDIIAVLDSTDIERTISIKEATMDSSDISTNYSIRSAQQTYEDYKDGIENGTNAQINAAQTTLSNAKTNLDTAEKKYKEAKEELDESTDATLVSVRKSVETAKKNLENAQQDYEDYIKEVSEEDYYSVENLKKASDDAYDLYMNKVNGTTDNAVREAKSKYEAALANYNALSSSENSDSDSVVAAKAAMEEAKAVYEAAAADTRTISELKEAYDDALKAYDNAKKNIDDSHDSMLTSLKRSYESVQTAYETAQRNLSDTERSLSKTLDNYYDSYTSAQSSYEDALLNYETVETAVNQTLEAYRRAYENALDLSDNTASTLELNSYYDQLEKCTITAPVSGVIDSLTIEEGGYAVQNQTVAVITDYDKLKVSIKIDEYDIGDVSTGDPVSVYINALDKTIDGTVGEISRKAVSSGGISYFTADIALSSDENVRAGMSVEVRRTTADLKDTLSISMDALQYEDDNTAYVLVKRGENEPEKVYITVGVTDGTYVQITDGISEGDVILYIPKNSYMDIYMMMGE